MVENTSVISWLSTTLEYREVSFITADHLYKLYCENHSGKDTRLLAKDKFSSVILKLFPNTKRTKIFLEGSQRISYNLGLKLEKQYTDSLTLPSECSIQRLPDLEITYPLDILINGRIQHTQLLFKENDFQLTVRGAIINHVNVGIEPKPAANCKTVQGLVYATQQLRLCKGHSWTHGQKYKSSSVIKESWSTLHDENSSTTHVRSKSCDIVLGWLSCSDICPKCKRYLKRAVHTDDENSNHESGAVHTDGENTKNSNHEHDESEKRLDHIYTKNPSTLKQDATDITLAASNNCTKKEDLQPSLDLVVEDHQDLLKIIEAELPSAPPNFKILLESQLSNAKSGLDPHRRRWDPKVISICLSLYCRSPRAYSDLKESGVLLLPSNRLLQYYKNSVYQTPGFNTDNLTWMRKEAQRHGVKGLGCHGGLILDEMQIQDDLQIVRRGNEWKLVGAVDLGPSCDNIDIILKKRKSVQMATHVLQFVFHGLYGFRWPVAYFATNPALAHQIYLNFWQAVDILDDNGFTIDYVVLDGASTNRCFQNLILGRNPSLQRDDDFTAVDVFDPDHRIAVCQDIKHAFKKLRNGIESSSSEHKSTSGRYLIHNGKCIVWEHWKAALEFNVQSGLRIHARLTKEHIEMTSASKMRNQLALDVLDKNMLHLMAAYQASTEEPRNLDSTIDLLKATSPLVDLFTDTNRHIRSFSDERLNQVNNSLSFFNNWEKEVTSSSELRIQKHLLTKETRDDINSALTGFIGLCKITLPQGGTVSPGYFNSDLVENFFCQQRGIHNGLNTNPTLAQYGPAVNAICLGQTTISNKSNSSSKTTVFRATTPGPLKSKKTSKRKRPEESQVRNVKPVA